MKFRLQAKYTLAITTLILAVSGLVAFVLQLQFQQTTARITAESLRLLEKVAMEQSAHEGEELFASLSADLVLPLARGDTAAIQRTVEDARTRYGLAYVVATDRSGRIYEAPTSGAPRPLDLGTTPRVRREADTLVISAPVQGAPPLGQVRIALPLAPVQQRHADLAAALGDVEAAALRDRGWQVSALITGLVLAGILLGGITARRLSGPVLALARSARALGKGELTQPLPAPRGDDEIAELAANLEGMRNSLNQSTVSRNLLYTIIDSLNEGLVVTDEDGLIRLANRAAGTLSGHEPEALYQMPVANLLAQPHKFALEMQTCERTEALLRHRSGGMTAVEVSLATVRHDGIRQQVYVFADITRRKRMEEELWLYRSRLEQLVVERTQELTAAIQELESFSYSVSHDLHAPLRAINGYSAALVEDYYDRLDDAGHAYLDRLGNATVRMGELIDGLLTLARVARSAIRCEAVDLSALASVIAEEIVANSPPRQVTFRIAPQLRAEVDPVLARLLLKNLFGNAWKFSRERPDALIEFGAQEWEGEKVFFVRDNGAGFDSNDAGGLFRPFHRLHTADEFPGTGIGLATVQRIVQRHGGWVRAEADAGVGATFYFTLPGRDQVDERRVSAREPLSNSVSSQEASGTR